MPPPDAGLICVKDSPIMRSKAIKALVISGMVSVIGLIVWPGCATPPLPSKRQSIMGRKKADFAFAKPARVDRAEVMRRLGAPDAYFEELSLVCYRVNDVTRRNLFLCLFVVPIEVTKRPGWEEVAFIKFDEHDAVRYSGIEMFFKGVASQQIPRTYLRNYKVRLKSAATNWVASQERKDKKIDAARAPRKF